MFPVMLFIFFCFFAILAMFFYLQRRQEQLARGLKEDITQLRVLLRALESRLDCLAQLCLAENGQEGEAASSPAAMDPLLRLSFEDPAKTIHDGDGLDIKMP